ILVTVTFSAGDVDYLIENRGGGAITGAGITTDAKFVALRTQNGSVLSWLMQEGTYCTFNGASLANLQGSVGSASGGNNAALNASVDGVSKATLYVPAALGLLSNGTPTAYSRSGDYVSLK